MNRQTSPKISTLKKWNTRQLVAYYTRVYGHAPAFTDRLWVKSTLIARAERLAGAASPLPFFNEVAAVRAIDRCQRSQRIEAGEEKQKFGRKLTERQVDQIKALKANGMSYRALAAQFGVNHQTIKNVVDGHHYTTSDVPVKSSPKQVFEWAERKDRLEWDSWLAENEVIEQSFAAALAA